MSELIENVHEVGLLVVPVLNALPELIIIYGLIITYHKMSPYIKLFKETH